MKQPALFFLFWSFTHGSIAQNELVSCYNSFAEVYGGTEDGGISRTESFFFQVNATITLSDIYLGEKKLVLKKGDTLVIQVSKFEPYNKSNSGEMDNQDPIEIAEPARFPMKEKYRVFQQQRRYYANVQYPFTWDGTVSYAFKKKTFVAIAKPGFDAGTTDYAP